ncbi:asparagine synthase (glutamine-hydrolyzing) [Mangrovibacillus cuniculi]|uniref:asparagine synthase (glutamine-hydrolyzing) n=1 Tax=Mangrovibacillus cuniculi TaxID=2593652 RepID=A0A7S8C9R3_9BACI|nr:asparagine synthase (glutamine-hydrolyzing) [Mangrovibacillus cuniculi]QPC46036.1 asparagine synthase (glutamine-hydrolyzing) [Mangrovibacillus cuniculi]
MCGITGWVNFSRPIVQEQSIVSAMTKTLKKRGPDATNTWFSEHAAFGHKRLVVVDPEGGTQPMTRMKNGHTYTLCYNGELYNTEDIRKVLLSKGYSFSGHSDTEVLLQSYIEWGEECVQHFNGIFAFAVWDSKKEQLFIGRDRLGVKPLFYLENKDGFFFASEIKAILAHPSVEAAVDRQGLGEMLGLGPSRPPGSGIFKDMKELRPAHALRISREGLKTWRYWNVESREHTDSFQTTVDNVKFLVKDAVTRQLVTDVPLCTFLSGGVDSSAITAIASNYYQEQGRGPLHTYSIDYEGNDQFFKANDFQPNADGYWIDIMSNTFKTNHTRSVITQDQLVENLQESVLVRDLPGMADVDSSLLWFCREIKKDFVVGLSGECADEIFGGYPWFHREDDFNRNGFPWMRSTKERQGLLRDSWAKKLSLEELVSTQYQQAINETPRLDGESPIEARRREITYLNMIWFMTTLLDRKDRMSMGASLEVRVPFADHRLVEYVWNVPWSFKNHENREKGLLRKALEDILPHEVLYRKKSPYPKTHNPRYTELVTKWLSSILEDKSSVLHEIFDQEKLKNIIETNGSAFTVPWFGQLMTGPQLIAHLAQIDVWFKHYNVKVIES